MTIELMLGQPPVGVVLAGGRSRRMGRDKAVLRLDGTTTLLERSIVALRAARLQELAVVVATSERGQELRCAIPALEKIRMIADEIPDRGPLGGLYSALRAYPRRDVLLVACDMPHLDARALRLLAAPHDADIVIPSIQGRAQPLHARYGPACLPIAVRLLGEGRLAMRELLDAPELRVCVRDDADLARYDIPSRAFANLNTPADLAALAAVDG